MGMEVKIELNSDGIRQLLMTDPGIKEDLQKRVDAVVGKAGPGHRGDVWVGKDRQRGTVRTTNRKAARLEAEDKNLTKSIDAAR